MITYTLKQFQELIGKTGVFVYTYDGVCPLCGVHKAGLYSKGISYSEIVINGLEELKWLQKRYKCRGLPHTAVYLHDQLLWDKASVFFDLQYKEISKIISDNKLG